MNYQSKIMTNENINNLIREPHELYKVLNDTSKYFIQTIENQINRLDKIKKDLSVWKKAYFLYDNEPHSLYRTRYYTYGVFSILLLVISLIFVTFNENARINNASQTIGPATYCLILCIILLFSCVFGTILNIVVYMFNLDDEFQRYDEQLQALKFALTKKYM